MIVTILQVQDVTSDKMRALMRLQFWKDTIDNMFKVHSINKTVFHPL